MKDVLKDFQASMDRLFEDVSTSIDRAFNHARQALDEIAVQTRLDKVESSPDPAAGVEPNSEKVIEEVEIRPDGTEIRRKTIIRKTTFKGT